MSSTASATQFVPIEYPDTDGQPMAETDIHRREMLAAIFALDEWYRTNPQVYVAGNLFVYYEPGDPRAVVAPDTFVVFGVPKRLRRIYKLWEEGQPPAVVIEFTSRGTRGQDLGEKRWQYEHLGVQEYFLFDPLAEYLRPRLQGFRLEGDYYAALHHQVRPEGEWSLPSRVLGLELHSVGSRLRFWDPQTGAYLRSPEEEAEDRRQAEQRAGQAEQRAEQEAQARREAELRIQATEAELAHLRAEVARLRGPNPEG